MSKTRIWLRLLALAVIIDFVAVRLAHVPGPAALLPALIGTIVASLACWTDAASSTRRTLLAMLSTLAMASLFAGLAVAMLAELDTQRVLLTLLAMASVAVCAHSWRAARRRRLPALGYHLSY